MKTKDKFATLGFTALCALSLEYGLMHHKSVLGALLGVFIAFVLLGVYVNQTSK